MRLKNIIFAMVALAAVSVAMVGCHTQKQSSATAIPDTIAEVTTVSDARAGLIALSHDYGSWRNLRMPMTIRLQSPKKISISGTMTMERGKSILLSLRFIGIEIAVVYITPDNILVLDKYNKRYVSESLAQFLGGFPVTLSNVQDLLIGRAFVLGKENLADVSADIADFDMLDNGAGWVYVPSSGIKDMNYGFTFASPRELLALMIKVAAHQPVTCMYEPSVVTPYGPLAPVLSVKASAGKTDIDASIEWNVSKARWNDDVDVRTVSIPSGYQKIESTDVVKMLKAF